MGPGAIRSRGRWAAALAVAITASCGETAATPDAGRADVPAAQDVLRTDVTVWPIPAGAPRVTLETYPKIDGSTSTLPLARVIACELLGLGYRWEGGIGSEGEAGIVPVAPTPAQEALASQVATRIVHNRTHQAYLNLVDGTADVILVANPPSPEELAYATDRGVTFEQRAVALDALVIVANAANAVTTLSPDQIRGVFSGRLTRWSEVGGADAEIHPFVRTENSGSQQLMNAIVMGSVPMGPWPADRRTAFMGALIDNIRGDALAIGYSVYYFVTFQYVTTGYRVLAVDGVAPTAASIGSRRYPFTAPVLAVTRADLAPTGLARQLRDWLLTADGQRTVARSGYVPVGP